MQDTRTRSASLALRQPELPVPHALERTYAARFPTCSALTAGAHTSETTRVFETASASFLFTLSPSPMPWAELEGPCETAWHWPQATKRMKAHAAQLTVSASSHTLDATDLMLELTRVIAAAALCTPAVGVYWRGATQVHDIKSFISEAVNASRAQLPLYLWLRFGLAREDDETTSLYTTGLAELELMEVELPHSTLDPQTLVDRAFNVAHYLLERGPVLEDGHTIGISETDKLEVKHSPSMWEAERRVYSLRYVPQ
jgi:hypothetical protein